MRPDEGLNVFLASNSLEDAKRLTAPYANATPVLVDVSDPAEVERLVAGADVVIRSVEISSVPSS